MTKPTALVIGGAGGLGSAIAHGLVDAGWTVLTASRDALAASDFDHVALDVTSEESVVAAFSEVEQRVGPLSALVNAAGITSSAPALETSLDDWNRVLTTNLTGTFLVNREFARAAVREEKGGSIVNIASLCARAGCELVPAYSASKAGVVGLSRSLAMEWAPLGIRVNSVIPGVFLTALNASRLQGTPRGDAARARTPMGRFGAPHEVAGAVEYLVSDRAGFVTGTEIVVDGGFLSAGLGTPRELA